MMKCVLVALSLDSSLPVPSLLQSTVSIFNTYSFDTPRYYIHPPASLFAKPLLLVPEVQVQALLDEINSTFRISIKLPRDPFLLAFYQDGTPAPTLLGTSQSRDAAGKMEQEIPPPAENHGECPPAASPETERSFERFKEKMERAAVAAKKKNAAIKKAKTKDRLAAHVRSCEALRRGQRYLGLRPVDHKGGLPLPDPSLSWDEQQKFEREQKIKHGHILEPLDIEKPAPHPFDRDVVFVSIDVEAFERNHNLITEVGISTLDTADIESLAPSQGGANWMEHIRSRHFRITDHEHLRNTTFCTGNPDKFQFGRSEFVSMKEVGQLVDSCFAPPYSTDFVHDGKSKPQDSTSVKSMQLPDQLQSVSLEAGESAQERVPGQQTSSNAVDGQGLANAEQKLANKATASSILTSPEDRETSEYDLDTTSIRTGPTKDTIISPTPTSPRPKTKYRNIVLVGHDLDSDLQYLSTLQSSIFHKPPIPTYPQPLECESHLRQHILESLDTALLYQVWKRETNITSLAKALIGVERTGWELHNGGNDARYTMETLVGVLVRSRVEEGEVSKAASSDSKSSNVKSGKHPEEVQAKEEKLARTIRERQEAVEKEERENAALWRHAIGPYGEDFDEQVLPDPYQSTQLEGTQDPNLAMHSAADPCTPGHVSASASASAHTIHSSHEAGEAYPWSSCPRASRDGGEPRGFEMPVPKGEKGKPSTRRREEVLRLQDEGEIGPPCDWGVGGRDGW